MHSTYLGVLALKYRVFQQYVPGLLEPKFTRPQIGKQIAVRDIRGPLALRQLGDFGFEKDNAFVAFFG